MVGAAASARSKRPTSALSSRRARPAAAYPGCFCFEGPLPVAFPGNFMPASYLLFCASVRRFRALFISATITMAITAEP